MADEPRQYWVRNDKGKMWGPLTFATIELLVTNGLIAGKLQGSRDGINFVFPGRLPDLRDAFPRELWGDSTEPLPEDDELAPSKVPVLKVGTSAGPPVVVRGASPNASPAPAPSRAPANAPAPGRPPEPAAAVAGPDGLPTSGDLASANPYNLYYLVASAKGAGRLTLSSDEVVFEIFFKKGAPEAVSSSRPDDDVGAFLVDKGVLKPEQLEDARKLAPGFGGSIVNALFALQLVSPGDVFKHLGDHALGLLGKALALNRGTFAFDGAAQAPATAMPLGEPWQIVCNAVRGLSPDELKERLGKRVESPVMKSGGKIDLAQLKLNAQEARAASYFDGVRSPNALCAALPAEADAILRTAFLLWSFEMMSFAEGAADPSPKPPPPAQPESATAAPPAEAAAAPTAASAQPTQNDGPAPKDAAPPRRPPPPVGKPPVLGGPAPSAASAAAERPKAATGAAGARPPPGAPPAGRPPVISGPPGGKPPVLGAPPGKPPVLSAKPPVVGPAAAKAPELPDNDPASLKAYLEKLQGKNHFEVLGLKQEDGAAQAKTAYFSLAKAFHPDTVPSGAAAEISKLKADIFALVSEAYRILGDEKLRAGYLEQLANGESAGEAVDAARIFAAEEAFQKGCILARARKFEEAVKQLDEAVKLNDKEGEFLAWRGWARFLAAKDKAAAKDGALKDLDAAIKMNPKCPASYFFVGQISKLLGDPADAQKWFKKTLSVDPNHLDAQRELRLASGQK